MKTKKAAIVMLVTVVFAGNGTWPWPKLAAASGPRQAEQGYIIQMKETWEEQDAGVIYRMRGLSHGTAIGQHTILTHNHFSHLTGAEPGGRMTFVGGDGRATVLAAEDLILESIDGGTLLIHLPGNVNLISAPVADQAVMDQLVAGDKLTVSYWDDESSQLVEQAFAIEHVRDGVATLLDPERRINTGDSGGGAFFEGRLVGNVWSINMLSSGVPAGSFRVALLPSYLVGPTGSLDWDGALGTGASPGVTAGPASPGAVMAR